MGKDGKVNLKFLKRSRENKLKEVRTANKKNIKIKYEKSNKLIFRGGMEQ
mgnify:CR=1 FL=1